VGEHVEAPVEDDRGHGRHRVDHALDRGPHTLGRRTPALLGPRGCASGPEQVEQVRPLGVVEAQGVGDPVDDAVRDAGGVAAFQTDVVLRRDAHEQRGLLTTQARHSAAVVAVCGQAGLPGRDPGPAGAEELTDLDPHGVAWAGLRAGHVDHCTSDGSGVGGHCR
jgi:hypothetical protein